MSMISRSIPFGVLCLALLSAHCGSESGVAGSGGPSSPPAGGEGTSAALGAPQVTAAGLDGRVELAWAAVPGATRYEVARATSAGAETLLTSVTSAGFVDNDVTPEASYFYKVTAKAGGVTGSPSPEVSARPITFDRWHQRHNSQILRSAATGGGVTVVVGDGMRIMSSTDGETWVDRRVPGAGRLNSVTYGAGLFVAVSTGGGIFTSPDGATWTKRNAGVTAALQGVAYGGNTSPKFMAVGDGSVILTSVDGISWQPATTNLHHTVGSTFDYRMNAIAYGDSTTFNYFVLSASDDNGNGGYMFYVDADSDFSTWMPSPAGSMGFLSGFRISGLAFGKYQSAATAVPSMHMVGGQGFWGHAEQTAPGVLTFATVIAGNANDTWWGVAFDGDDTLKVFGGARLLSCSISTTCKAGVNGWAAESLPPNQSLTGGAFGNGGFLSFGSDELVAREPAGKTSAWQEVHRSNGTWDFITLAHAGGVGDNIVAVGGTGKYLVSKDRGDTFNPAASPANVYLSRARGLGGQIYVVGSASTIMRSRDGAPGSWQVATVSPTTASLRDIAASPSLYIAAGGAGETFTSPDGLTWTHVPAPGSGHDVGTLVYDGQVFVAATDDAHILTTTDGVTWKDALFDDMPQGKLFGVAATADRIVVNGSSGHVWVSTDHGASFTPHHLPQGPTFNGLAFSAGTWVASGADATMYPVLYTSTDGLTWTKRGETPSLPFGVAEVSGRVFVMGYEGSIYSTY